MEIKSKCKKSRKKSKTNKYNEKFDKILQQQREIFDLQQLLEISKSLNSILDFERLIEAILYGLMAQLKIISVAVFTKKSFDDDVFVLNRNHLGFEVNYGFNYSISITHPVLAKLEKEKNGLSFEEIKKLGHTDEIMNEILKLKPSFFIPLKAKNKLVGFFLLGDRLESTCEYTDYEKKIMENMASLSAVAINNALLLEMTTTDLMTHLKLKYYFFAVLSERLATVEVESDELRPLSILMLDIDFFKRVNDTYGHMAGDMVLTEVAGIIKSCIRPADVASRYGGEEFVVLLDDTTVEQAVVIAERIRTRVQDSVIQYDNQKIQVTISIGVSGFKFDLELAKDLVDRADKALYESKQNGRNRVTVSQENLV